MRREGGREGGGKERKLRGEGVAGRHGRIPLSCPSHPFCFSFALPPSRPPARPPALPSPSHAHTGMRDARTRRRAAAESAPRPPVARGPSPAAGRGGRRWRGLMAAAGCH